MSTHTSMMTIKLVVEVPDEHVPAFNRAMTGNDRDIILAAERAMNEVLNLGLTDDRIEVSPETDHLI